MDRPQTSAAGPVVVAVVQGVDYWWCACGRSATQPMCDGAATGSACVPVKFTAERTGRLWFCGCRRTGMAPLCDGTHHTTPP